MDSEGESILKVGWEWAKERDRRVITAFCAGMDRGEGGEEVVRERAINFETDQGHRGAEVLQRSWEQFFFFLSYADVYALTSLI